MCHVYRSVSACADERGGSPSEINGGSRGRGHRKAGYPAAISDASFLFSVRKKKPRWAPAQRERERAREKKNHSAINQFLHAFLFSFSLPAAPRCIVLLARAATEYYIWPLCMQQPEGSPIKSPTITMYAEPANATHMSLLGKSGFSKKKKEKKVEFSKKKKWFS